MNTLDEKLNELAREADSAIRVQEGTPGNLIVTLDRPEMVAILRRAIREAVVESGAISALQGHTGWNLNFDSAGKELPMTKPEAVERALAALRALTNDNP